MMELRLVPSDPALAQFIGAVNAVAGGTGFGLKRTQAAFVQIVSAMADSWRSAVGNPYDKTISIKKNSPFSYTIYSNDKMVGWKENGLGPFDMKQTHTRGLKSRVVKPRVRNGKTITSWIQKRKDGTPYIVKAGDPYLIIPFRHGTQEGSRYSGGRKTYNRIVGGSVEQSMRNQLYMITEKVNSKKFERSTVLTDPSESQKKEPNALGKMIERAEYKWGSRLELEDTIENQDLQGMVAMKVSTGGSQFLTFRVVSKNSPQSSWMHPGIPAEHNLNRIAVTGQNEITRILENAMKEDLGIIE